jgi:hypothetical protein
MLQVQRQLAPQEVESPVQMVLALLAVESPVQQQLARQVQELKQALHHRR